MKQLFIINDVGTEYEITGTRLEKDGYVVDTDLFYESPSSEFFETVKGLLDGSNEIKYLKTVSPSETGDLTVTGLDALTVYKSNMRTKASMIFKNRVEVTIGFDFYAFMLANNFLANAGYFITEENREEKYLEIVNAGDAALTEALEKYLAAHDDISVYYHHYANFKELKTAIDAAATTTAVDTAYADFAALYA